MKILIDSTNNKLFRVKENPKTLLSIGSGDTKVELTKTSKGYTINIGEDGLESWDGTKRDWQAMKQLVSGKISNFSVKKVIDGIKWNEEIKIGSNWRDEGKFINYSFTSSEDSLETAVRLSDMKKILKKMNL